MSGALLTVRGLERHFDGLRAVDGVSFEVAPHEVVSIIGPNGSGKTTTLNLVTGTIPAHGGSIVLDGERIDHADTARIAEQGIARTFQNGRVFATLSVADNIEVGIHSTLRASRPFRRLSHLFLLRWIPLLAELYIAIVGTPASRREQRRIAETVDEEIERFEARLGPRRDDPAYTLSYANRRRTEIARALALRPKLLVLDEPTAGMNQSETAEAPRRGVQKRTVGPTYSIASARPKRPSRAAPCARPPAIQKQPAVASHARMRTKFRRSVASWRGIASTMKAVRPTCMLA